MVPELGSVPIPCPDPHGGSCYSVSGKIQLDPSHLSKHIYIRGWSGGTYDGVGGAVDGPEGDVALVQLQRAGPRRSRQPERLAASESGRRHREGSPRWADAWPPPTQPLGKWEWEQRRRQENFGGRTRHSCGASVSVPGRQPGAGLDPCILWTSCLARL